MVRRLVQRQPMLGQFRGTLKVAGEYGVCAADMVSQRRRARVARTLREFEQLRGQNLRCWLLGAHQVVVKQAPQDRKHLCHLAHVAAQLTSAFEGVTDFGRCVPSRISQCRSKVSLQR